MGRMEERAASSNPKRRAIIDAATLVFGRDGFSRATVDVICAEADVSKRTMYKYFPDKEQLFVAALLEGAEEVSAAVRQAADFHLHKIVDIRSDLIAFAAARAEAVLGDREHAAFSRVIKAEINHVPPGVLKKWLDVGPRASHRDIAKHFDRMRDDGFLQYDDVDVAVTHFTLLTFSELAQRSFDGALPMPPKETNGVIEVGVDAFLNLYS